MSKVTPFLWFNNNAEEAITLYTSLIPNSRIVSMSRYPEGIPGVGGMVMSATFELDGREFMALNGGPDYQFNEAFSLFVNCATQEEVDTLWSKLIADGGSESRCGWLKDKFGLSWQIIPTLLGELMGDPDPVKSQRVMQAMLQMNKIDSAALQAAYDQA